MSAPQLDLFRRREPPALWERFGAPSTYMCSWCGVSQGHDRSRDPDWYASCPSLVDHRDRRCPDCAIAPTDPALGGGEPWKVQP